ncbi:hypothetical protein [Endozoicomonas sp. SCSIO W0465]|uniref:hypothetical protein n=1 Tax=Endozoicomonas sp. SCSIO W0465 TaxID=2918516 RepID=UPI002075152B|nr:hypothetical protein [Endozoicomonas sp. SCSIO W0465]USE37769.1 hypothetical protein MJO57_06115 [Endozoicomonas sp. SCSIO W0465]
MDSEQIKKELGSEALFDINGAFHPEGKAPCEQVTDLRKFKGQVVAEPSGVAEVSGKKGGESTEYPAEPWEDDANALEHRLFSDINALLAVAISDKNKLRKSLSELYKQAHELMTCYNQRIQSLLMEDRFLYRHSSEISALMIRGLMPPLENIKNLEKALTSTRKKSEQEPVDQLQKSAMDELTKVEKILKDAKNRLAKYTKPLKPEQLLQKQLTQRLEREASELHSELHQPMQKTDVSASLQNMAGTSAKPLSTIKAEPAAAVSPAHHKSEKQTYSAEDLVSTQLRALAITLDAASPAAEKRTIQSIICYVESEYQKYVPLSPFLSAARQKCELLSMNADKACHACQDAIAVLENVSSANEPALSPEVLMQIDRAIGKLASFDKKLPGEVWQLLTELTPDQSDSRYHLLNLLCRKLLLDGPTPLTQKAVLNKFKDVGQLLRQSEERADAKVFDQQFINVYGQIFNSPTHLKKALNVANKPHETHALLQMFSRQKTDDQGRFAEMIEAFNTIGAEQQRDCLISGADAFDCLITSIPEKLTAEINSYRPSEPNQAHKQLTHAVLAKYSDYHNAIELIRRQRESINKQGKISRPEHAKILAKFSKQLAETLTCPDNRQEVLLQDIDTELQKITAQSPINAQVKQSIAGCRTHIIDALRERSLTNDQFSRIITLFLEVQTQIEEPGAVQTGINSVEIPEALIQAMASLENGTAPKWYNELFTGQIQEQRVNTLGVVNNILDACRQTSAAIMPVASFIEASAQEITKDNDDPLIKQLGAEMQAYANWLKTA